MAKGVIEKYPFYCDHLGAFDGDKADVAINFSVNKDAGKGLKAYITKYAFDDEEGGLMRTYLVRTCNTEELVGYFSIKAGLISGNEEEVDGQIVLDTLPGVELANFAVNSAYIDKHPDYKGIGAIIFSDCILPLIEETAKIVGVRVVYLFALPFEKLIERYKTYGFMRLDPESESNLNSRLKPEYDQSCVFMYQPI